MVDRGILDVLGTPQERQHKVLRLALEARVEHWPHDGYHYRSAGDLLLQHGRFFSGRELPEEYAHLKGLPGRCFVNALEACQADPNLRYFEGVYAIGDSHYTPHAWCLDPEGCLLEVSLSTQADEIAQARRKGTGLPVLGLDHWGYWGVELHPELVEFVIAQQDACGVLDRPAADALDGNPATVEWREDWPILRLPYDKDRRTL